MINKILLTVACCGFLMQKDAYSSMIEELDMRSPAAFVSTIKIKDPRDENISFLSEELEWNAIVQHGKLEKARSYIYSFFLNQNSYDLECFLEKNGLSTDSIPSYADYYLAEDKAAIGEIIEQQISLLESRLN